jgi:hypothetical protein
LAHEYEADADTQEPFYAALRHTREGGGSLPVARLAGTASTLAADYQNVTAEVLQRMKMALAVDEHEPTAV